MDRRLLVFLFACFLIDCGAFSASDEGEPPTPDGATQTCVFDDPASKLDECKVAP